MSRQNDFKISQKMNVESKRYLDRASSISGISLCEFVKLHSLQAAKNIVDRFEKIALSERDSLIVLEALENPPMPNPKLLEAAIAFMLVK